MKLLVCPKCKKELILSEKTYKCENNHCYDIAKQGYLNLLLGSTKGSGDDKEMCRARHTFHSSDYYRILGDRLSEICVDYNCKTIIDAGCGEGYYIRKIRDYYEKNNIQNFSLCGIDLAKEAIILGSRIEKDYLNKIEYAVAGIFDMPISCESVDCVLSVFAPLPVQEVYRVLNNNGIMIVVSPGEKHLEGLKRLIYSNAYDNEVANKEFYGFILEDRVYISDNIFVTGENIKNLFHMTPYFWKTSEKDAAKLNNLKALETKTEFVISIYKKLENI